MSSIFTVRELTASIKGSLEKNFPFVWVKGEVTNLARPSSGHIYFSLKDSEAMLHCVWFKNAQRSEEKFDPLTGEVFEDGPRPSLAMSLENGQEILCAGHISVYGPRGSYQLTIALVQKDGQGALHAAFEALKAKLMAKGYFASERKKALPYDPKQVAVITSPQGAAIYDFLRIAQGAGTGSEIRIYPVPVQGEGAAPAIVQAIQQVEREGKAQIIVLIRGGGSLEDLWAFNEEMVADAIYACSLPVLAGIGHEVDVSMADMTADMRAATPTHAAQLLWPSRHELMQRLDGLDWAVQEAGQGLLRRHELALQHKEQALTWLSPMQSWQRKEEFLQHCVQRLQHCMQQGLGQKERQLERARQDLPQSVSHLEPLAMTLETASLRLQHAAQRLVAEHEKRLSPLEQTLPSLMQHKEGAWNHALHMLQLQLESLSPLAPLQRGYALMQDAKGHVLRSVTHVQQGQEVHMQLADGRIAATVKDIQSTRHTQ